MSMTIGWCYFVPIENLADAVNAVREIGETGGTASLPLTLPDGRIVQGPFGRMHLDRETNTYSTRPAKLSGSGDAVGGEIVIRSVVDETIREYLDPDHAERRTRDRHGNRFVYLAMSVALTLGERYAEVVFSSEARDIGMIIALPGTVRDLLDCVASQADAVSALEYCDGTYSTRAPDGRTISTDGPDLDPNGDWGPDEVVAYFVAETESSG